MKYSFVDRLQDFEFHDSFWKMLSWEDDEVVIELRCLNVHKSALLEPVDTDMEIENARMIFRGFSQLTYEPSRVWKTDEKGKSYTDEPQIIHSGKAAQKFFIAEMKENPMILNLSYCDRKCEIDGCGTDPYFTFCFSFQHVEIAWDTFRGAAWYEREQHARIERIGG